MKRAGAVLSLIFGGVMMSGVAQAGFTPLGGPILLSNLLSSCTGLTCVSGFTDGDKTFNDFTWTLTGSGLTTPPLSDPTAGITITPGEMSDGDIAFQVTGTLSAISIDGSFSNLDALFGYTVTATAPLIEDVGTTFNGSCSVPTKCSVSLTEDAYGTKVDGSTLNGVLLGQLVVLNPPPDSNVTADVQLTNGTPPVPVVVKQLDITKDIALSAFTSTDPGSTVASISFIDQYFSQVPEPSNYLFVLGTGLLAMFYFVRRRPS